MWVVFFCSASAILSTVAKEKVHLNKHQYREKERALE
jgi:hypothetical protein